MFDRSWKALLDPGDAEVFFDLDPRPRFVAAATEFDRGNAWWLAELSRLIYREEADEASGLAGRQRRDEILAGVGLTEERFFHRRHTQCALIRPRGDAAAFAVLVFRGSSQLRDWLSNVRAVLADWPAGGRVHHGFRRAIDAVWGEVSEHLRGVDAPLYCTGHSLGGALSVLAASLVEPRAVYTFGAPRVGNAGFTAILPAARIYRVVNHLDVVTSLPPEGEPLGFRHAGVLHYLSGDGRHLIEPEAAELSELRRAAAAIDVADERRWFEPLPILSDHAPINYVARLAALR